MIDIWDKIVFPRDLRIGTMLIGSVGTVLYSVFLGLILSNKPWQLTELFEKEGFKTGLEHAGLTSFSYAMMIFMIFICICMLITAPILVIGAFKQKPGLLLPWQVAYAFVLPFSIINVIGSFLVGEQQVFTYIGIPAFFGDCYSYYYIWTFKQQLKEKANHPFDQS